GDEHGASARDAGPDGADRHVAGKRRLLVGQADDLRADEGRPLLRFELPEQVVERDAGAGVRDREEDRWFDDAPTLTGAAPDHVDAGAAGDRKEPGAPAGVASERRQGPHRAYVR